MGVDGPVVGGATTLLLHPSTSSSLTATLTVTWANSYEHA